MVVCNKHLSTFYFYIIIDTLVGMLMALFALVVTLKWLIGLQISIGYENSDETTK